MTYEQCTFLNDSSKSELRTIVDFSGNEKSSHASDDDEGRDKDKRSSTNDSKDSERNSDCEADDTNVRENVSRRNQGVSSIVTQSLRRHLLHWKTVECAPYREAIG